MNGYYDRYKKFRMNGDIGFVPFIEIGKLGSDLYIEWDKNKMRLDMLSYKYYSDPNYGWLIMLANPKLGSMEFSIPDGVTMRIPYPLESAINRYEAKVEEYLENRV